MDGQPLVYRGYARFAFLVLTTVVMAGVAIVGVVAGKALGVLICGAVAVACGWDLRRRCLRAELLDDGTLAVRQLLRRTNLDVRSVRAIRFRDGGEDTDTFTVTFDGGSFLMDSSRRSRALVDALALRNPAITVTGE